MKRILFFILLALPLGVLLGCVPKGGGGNVTDDAASDTGTSDVTDTATDAETDEPEGPATLSGAYSGIFPIGVAVPNTVLSDLGKYGDVLDEFDLITCENETKPDALLDRAANAADPEKYYTSPKVNFSSAKLAAEYAKSHGKRLRLHTLVWHSQTPAWFFTEDYTDGGAPVSREVMLGRMESYIASVLGYFDENYPGLIYAVDVVNEAFDVGDGDVNGIRMKNSKWYEVVGPDFVYYAFLYARRYAPEGVRLFYNDYACMWKVDLILNNLSRVKDDGLIDGIGMQAHLSVDDPVPQFLAAAKRFSDEGYEVQLSELDVGVKSKDDFERQGQFYRSLLSGLVKLKTDGANITAVTVWGVSDGNTWRPTELPLLFNADLSEKPAYEGFIGGAE